MLKKEKNEFKQVYSEMHEREAKFKLFCNELKYETYQNSSKMLSH